MHCIVFDHDHIAVAIPLYFDFIVNVQGINPCKFSLCYDPYPGCAVGRADKGHGCDQGCRSNEYKKEQEICFSKRQIHGIVPFFKIY